MNNQALRFGARPVVSGEDLKTDEDYIHLKKFGIKYVVCLQMGYLDFFFKKMRNHEAIACIKHGLIPVHVMMSDFCVPTYEQIAAVLDLISSSSSEKYSGVYFHCRRGKDRTGMVRAVYRMAFQNWSVRDAVQEMDRIGHAKHVYFWWQKYIPIYAKRYKEERGL